MIHRTLLVPGAALLFGIAMSFLASAADVVVRGAGATFPFPVYAKWAEEYRRLSGVTVTYEPVGSGEGVARIARGDVAFGATDVPLSDEELRRIGAVQFPAVIGAVVPVINLNGIQAGQLHLNAAVLADIYLGKVTHWNAPAIAQLNPGFALPSTRITVVHRRESSGTTYLWSTFLARGSPDWQAAVGAGRELQWPVGVAATGNEGVASYVRRTKASIGYVEYAYARQHSLLTISVANRDGAWVQPRLASFAAAAHQAPWRDAGDLRQLLIDEPGAASWPITGASFIVLRAAPADAQPSREAMKFFAWALRHGAAIAEAMDYVAIPEPALPLIEQSWSRVTSPGGESLWPPRSGATR